MVLSDDSQLTWSARLFTCIGVSFVEGDNLIASLSSSYNR